MRNGYVLMTVVLGLMIGLTGCGGDGDGTGNLWHPANTNSNNQIEEPATVDPSHAFHGMYDAKYWYTGTRSRPMHLVLHGDGRIVVDEGAFEGTVTADRSFVLQGDDGVFDGRVTIREGEWYIDATGRTSSCRITAEYKTADQPECPVNQNRGSGWVSLGNGWMFYPVQSGDLTVFTATVSVRSRNDTEVGWAAFCQPGVPRYVYGVVSAQNDRLTTGMVGYTTGGSSGGNQTINAGRWIKFHIVGGSSVTPTGRWIDHQQFTHCWDTQPSTTDYGGGAYSYTSADGRDLIPASGQFGIIARGRTDIEFAVH